VAGYCRADYVVVLIFVGLTTPQISVLRVGNRKRTGGHDVPLDKLLERFPRTQAAIGQAANVADLTLMVDNSLDRSAAFQFARAQRKKRVLFDIRDPAYRVDAAARAVADPWLQKVVGTFKAPRARK
jgi:predicted ABC-type ATPase